MSANAPLHEVRRAVLGDATGLARLSSQLGYAIDADAMRRQLAGALASTDDAVLVAAVGDAVAGFAHVARRRLLVEADCAELLALVVDEASRSRGLGAALLRAAEDWARSEGVASLRLRSRETRERAHAFYRREGYELWKSQRVFRRPLS